MSRNLEITVLAVNVCLDLSFLVSGDEVKQSTLAPPVFRIYLSTRLTCQPKRFSAIHHVKRSANSSRPQAIAPPTIPTAAPIINWILRLRKFGIGRRTQRASAPLSRRTVVPMVFARSPNCCEKSLMNSRGVKADTLRSPNSCRIRRKFSQSSRQSGTNVEVQFTAASAE